MIRLAGLAAALVTAATAVGSTAANPGCSPRRAAVTLTVKAHCYIGTERADLIVGAAAGDLIYGWAGADLIYGLAGDDRIFAGSENDLVYGGPGNDLIDPALGRDRVYGGLGDDVIHVGGGEPDRIWCGPGYDVAYVDRLDRVAKDCEEVVVRRGYP